MSSICTVKNEQTIQHTLSSNYPTWRVSNFDSRRFGPDKLQSILDSIFDKNSDFFRSETVGHSFEGRPINLISVGNGPTTILLWSQMHGDESTATMAIADILNYLAQDKNEEIRNTIPSSICAGGASQPDPAQAGLAGASGGNLLSSLHLLFLPMLNPDGASRFQRRTSQGIDMNRDALALQTPESKLLKKIQHQFKPTFGFNLHDQELSTVGSTNNLTAMALLVPAIDFLKTDNDVRLRAKKVAASITTVLEEFAPGRIARYDDSFEPRAFGDNMQRWGTSTVLIESGHALNDPEKDSIRKLNAVGILTALHAIATGDYLSSPLKPYESLPTNGKSAYTVLIRDVVLNHQNGKGTRADLGISYQIDTHLEDVPVLADIGDLSQFRGLFEVEAGGRSVEQTVLEIGKPFEWQRYFPSEGFRKEY